MTQPLPKKIFCFGFGYTAEALHRLLAPQGVRFAGTCRSEERRIELSAMEVEAYTFQRGQPLGNLAEIFRDVDAVLSTVPPDDEGDPVLDQHHDDLGSVEKLLWVGYLSTTGVYGDRNGEWVDEATSVTPTSERGKRRAEAEAGWLRLYHWRKLPVHIFRLPAIYGPGRNPLVGVKDGTAQRIDKPDQVFSRIHVDDIASVLAASMQKPNAGSVYNVCDDEPIAPEVVVAFAAELLGREPPPLIPFEQASLSPMARSFYTENKRVSNKRIKEELGVTLAYPSYREGLRALLDVDGNDTLPQPPLSSDKVSSSSAMALGEERR